MVSVVITVLNEIKSIKLLLIALAKQTMLPEEVIVVDGGSSDGTYEKLKQLASGKWGFKLIVAQKIGNRSVGRNEALKLAKSQWLAITDAGCVPDKDWLAELIGAKNKNDQECKIVSGYFYPLAENGMEQAFSCYALAMPRVIKDNFMLPTTRSMLIKKSVLQKLDGFDEGLSDNEDYALARKALRANLRSKMVFTPRAKVGWIPSKTCGEFARTIYRFARGDAYAGLWRPKVILIFVRYLLGLTLLLIGLLSHLSVLILLLTLAVLCYLAWAVLKNFSYAKKGWYYLPILQVMTDILVILGSLHGGWLNRNHGKYCD